MTISLDTRARYFIEYKDGTNDYTVPRDWHATIDRILNGDDDSPQSSPEPASRSSSPVGSNLKTAATVVKAAAAFAGGVAAGESLSNDIILDTDGDPTNDVSTGKLLVDGLKVLSLLFN